MISPTRRLPLVVVCAVFAPGITSALELPGDVPVRKDGLWRMERTGTMSDGKTAFEIQKIWEICLDARADHALHELDVREQQADLSGLKQSCEEPRARFSGSVLSWTMHCSGPSSVNSKTGRAEIHHTTTFVTDDETRAETVVTVGPDQKRGRVVTHMTRAGACAGGATPGDMMLMHWRVNGEETLKARQSRNLDREIEDQKTFTASRLAR